MMWTRLGDFRPMMNSKQVWGTMLKVTLLAALVLTILLVAFATFLVVLPFALVGGLALHLYLRRKLRHVRRQTSSRLDVIDGDYTLIEK
jgi:Flp pilus assembly protein TadB